MNHSPVLPSLLFPSFPLLLLPFNQNTLLCSHYRSKASVLHPPSLLLTLSLLLLLNTLTSPHFHFSLRSFFIFVFSVGKVKTELPLQAMTLTGKEHAQAAIRRLKERGQTNLSGGLLSGLQQIMMAKAGEDKAAKIESVLLFTDGRANIGIRDTPTITKATRCGCWPFHMSTCFCVYLCKCFYCLVSL